MSESYKKHIAEFIEQQRRANPEKVMTQDQSNWLISQERNLPEVLPPPVVINKFTQQLEQLEQQAGYHEGNAHNNYNNEEDDFNDFNSYKEVPMKDQFNLYDKSGKLKSAVKTQAIPISTLAQQLAQEIAEREAQLEAERQEYLTR